MSVTFNGTDQFLIRENTMPDYNAAYTYCFWLNPTDLDQYYWDLNYSNSNFDAVYLDAAGHFNIEANIGGSYGSGGAGSTVRSTGTWYFVAIRRSGVAAIELWVNTAVETTTCTNDVTGRTAAARTYLARGGSSTGAYGACSMTQGRIWTRALSDAELNLERASTTAVARDAALWAEWRLPDSGAGMLTDSSGNTRPLENWGFPPTTGADDPVQGGGTGLMWL